MRVGSKREGVRPLPVEQAEDVVHRCGGQAFPVAYAAGVIAYRCRKCGERFGSDDAA